MSTVFLSVPMFIFVLSQEWGIFNKETLSVSLQEDSLNQILISR